MIIILLVQNARSKATASNNDLHNLCQLSHQVSAIKYPVDPPLDAPTETKIDIGLRHRADGLRPFDVLVEARSDSVPTIVVAGGVFETFGTVSLLIFAEDLIDSRKRATVLWATNSVLTFQSRGDGALRRCRLRHTWERRPVVLIWSRSSERLADIVGRAILRLHQSAKPREV